MWLAEFVRFKRPTHSSYYENNLIELPEVFRVPAIAEQLVSVIQLPKTLTAEIESERQKIKAKSSAAS
ncbi:MAG: hypothetical protein ACOY4O_17725 [Pseudomonadota bacterium]